MNSKAGTLVNKTQHHSQQNNNQNLQQPPEFVNDLGNPSSPAKSEVRILNYYNNDIQILLKIANFYLNYHFSQMWSFQLTESVD